MKVRELMARLAWADPEDNVVLDPDSQCLRLFRTRPGLFQPLDDLEVLGLTDQDKEFLRAMRIDEGGFI